MSEEAAQQGTSGPLAGRTAVITGASRGIGRAVALGLAREGAHVIAIARTKGALEELDDEIRAAGGACSLITLNLKHSDKVDALGPTLYQRWQHIDIFVANAGVLGTLTPVAHILDRDWDEVVAINLSANMRMIRTLDPLLRRSDAHVRQHRQSRPHAHGDARSRLPRRKLGEAESAGSRGAAVHRSGQPNLRGHRPALRLRGLRKVMPIAVPDQSGISITMPS